MIGPVTDGTLILFVSVQLILLINVVFFIVSALLLVFLPQKEEIKRRTLQVLSDFAVVKNTLRIITVLII